MFTTSVFRDLTEMSSPITVDTAIRWFQVIGAAETLYPLSVYAERTFGALVHEADFLDRFAAALAAIALDEAVYDGREDLGLVHFLGADPGATGPAT